jgi:hypothetical protein
VAEWREWESGRVPNEKAVVAAGEPSGIAYLDGAAVDSDLGAEDSKTSEIEAANKEIELHNDAIIFNYNIAKSITAIMELVNDIYYAIVTIIVTISNNLVNAKRNIAVKNIAVKNIDANIDANIEANIDDNISKTKVIAAYLKQKIEDAKKTNTDIMNLKNKS